MTQVSEQDLEWLDRYLDNDLTDAEAVGLEARLSADAALAAELDLLREHRALRATAFASAEPGDVEAQQLQWYIKGGLSREIGRADTASRAADQRTRRLAGYAGMFSRIAAVLVVGFAVGYGYRGGAVPQVSPSGQSVVRIDDRTVGGPVRAVAGDAGGVSDEQIGAGAMFVDDPNRLRVVGNITTPSNLNTGGFEVALRDQTGNVVGVKRFRTLQEARDFVTEVERYQQRNRQSQKNGVRFVGDDF